MRCERKTFRPHRPPGRLTTAIDTSRPIVDTDLIDKLSLAEKKLMKLQHRNGRKRANIKYKVKCVIPHEEGRRGAHLLVIGREFVDG